MKNPLFLLLFVLGFTLTTTAQTVPGEKMVPATVKTKFKTDFPSASLKRWEVKAVVKEYVAIFVDQNLNKRIRYKADGSPVIMYIHYPGASVPATYTSKLTTEFPGYKIDWATEWKNYINGNNFVEVRMSKPGYVVKVIVDTNGNPVTDEKKTKEDLKTLGESEQDNSNN